MEIWRIELLGGLRARSLKSRDVEIERFRTHKTGALLALLAFYRRPLSREVLIGELWPDAAPDSGRNNLRIALSSLRRQLELPHVEPGSVLIANRSIAALNARTVATDVAEFEVACRAAQTLNDAVGSDLKADVAGLLALQKQWQTACDCYSGALLPGFYENWISPQERRLDVLFARAIRHLIAVCRARDDTNALMAATQRGLMSEPENLEWLAATTQWRTSIAVPASPKTSSGALEPPPIAPQKSIAAEVILPPQWTRFVGREAEMAHLNSLLCDPLSRLVTLWGLGGTGKTRLAIETARSLSEQKADITGNENANEKSPAPQKPFAAIYWVPLSSVEGAEFILDAILTATATTFAPTEIASQTPPNSSLDDLSRALDNRRVLLILDNFEQLVPTGSALVEQMLARWPQLTILITSRQLLRARGEHVAPLPPLSVPSADAVTPAALMECEAVRLFLDRARHTRADFAVTPRNMADVAALMDCLEGSPLAIELAAARAGVLSPRAMLGQLEAPLQFLARRAPVAPIGAVAESSASTCRWDDNAIERDRARHASLRACVDWSFGMLSPILQQFWLRLAIFRGGWTGDAAREVCGQDPDAPVLDWLEQLRDASLIEIVNHADEAPVRFSMSQTLREFALSQHNETQREELEARHARYFVQLAQRIEAHFNQTGNWKLDEIGEPEAEHLNWRAVFERATTAATSSAGSSHARQMREWGLHLMGAMWWFWSLHGHLREGRSLTQQWIPFASSLESFLSNQAQNPDETSLSDDWPRLWAGAQSCAGILAFHVGEGAEARARLQMAQEIWNRLGYVLASAGAWNYLGAVALSHGDIEAARFNYASSLRVHAQHPTPEQPDARAMAIALSCMANVEYAANDFVACRKVIARARKLWIEVNNRSGLAWLLGIEGWMYESVEDWPAARALHERALLLRRQNKAARGVAASLADLARVASAQECFDEAREMGRESLQSHWNHGQQREALSCLEGLSGSFDHFNRESVQRAAQLAAAAKCLRQLHPFVLQYQQKTIERAHNRLSQFLSEDELRALSLVGQTLSFEEAVELALQI